MSFQGNTPEALLPRSDSKNPATTCKGLTATGRPCRRALSSSQNQSPGPSPVRDSSGVIAVLDEGTAAAFFCWQHKDQAESLVARLEQKARTRIIPLREKSSIDTLAERVGILDLVGTNGDQEHKPYTFEQSGRSEPSRVRKRGMLPQEWQSIQNPLMSVPEEIVQSSINASTVHGCPYKPNRKRTELVRRSNVKASWNCCIQVQDDDLPPPRRKEGHHRTTASTGPPPEPKTRTATISNKDQSTSRKLIANPEMEQRPSRMHTSDHNYHDSHRPASQPLASSSSPPHSQTSAFLSLIPPHLSPTTTSALLAELSRPISPADEAGYIYIFWLTPESDESKPDDETASSILDPFDTHTPTPSPQRRSGAHHQHHNPNTQAHDHANEQRTTQALQRYASIKRTANEPQQILLKIGRASNVHRRLSQWTYQCGQNITLIRYYPHNSGPKQIPHVHKVERLVHLELADQRVRDHGKCERCGREHKEWFAVEATRLGVRAVDETVRRWARWAEMQAF